MFDKDFLRNLQLIEEREYYENEFISIDDIQKSDELDYYTTPHFEKYFLEVVEIIQYSYEDELDLEFDFDDYFIQLRDEQLIEQREIYEHEYSAIPWEIVEYNPFNLQIESYEKQISCPDYFDPYFEDNFYFEEYNMDAAYCGGQLLGYIVDDNESFEEFDYPEGPDENLCGFKYPEPDYFDDVYFDFPDDFCDYPEPDYEIEFYESVDSCEKEEKHIQMLIDEHIAEEKEFLEFLSKQEIPEEYLPLEVMDEIILS